MEMRERLRKSQTREAQAKKIVKRAAYDNAREATQTTQPQASTNNLLIGISRQDNYWHHTYKQAIYEGMRVRYQIEK